MAADDHVLQFSEGDAHAYKPLQSDKISMCTLQKFSKFLLFFNLDPGQIWKMDILSRSTFFPSKNRRSTAALIIMVVLNFSSESNVSIALLWDSSSSLKRLSIAFHCYCVFVASPQRPFQICCGNMYPGSL